MWDFYLWPSHDSSRKGYKAGSCDQSHLAHLLAASRSWTLILDLDSLKIREAKDGTGLIQIFVRQSSTRRS
jgi:hypothetical protein